MLKIVSCKLFVPYSLMTVQGSSTTLAICHELDLLYGGPL